MRRLVLFAFAACTLVLLGNTLMGCGSARQPYRNFRAYYNTFYNAEKAFAKGEKNLEQQDIPVFRDTYLDLFPTPNTDQGARASEFESAIKKSADLLRNYPESKWTDDATLLIGKAYFYQGNFTGAVTKFEETIAVAETEGFEQPERSDEARFWLARTYIAEREFEEATTLLTESLAREEATPRWLPRLQLVQGALYVQQERWNEAAEALEEGLEGNRDDELGARAQFLLGQIYEELDRPEDAATAYGAVAQYQPLYELGFAAQLSEALVRGRYLDTEAGLRVLRRLASDDKNLTGINRIDLGRAQIMGETSRVADAQELYESLLYDKKIQLSAEERAQAHYRVAELYRDGYGDFVRASAHFDTASTGLNRGGGRPAPGIVYTRDAVREPQQTAQRYRTYAQAALSMAEADSLIALGELSDDDFGDRVAQIQRDLQEQADRRRELLNDARRRAEFGDEGFASVRSPVGGSRPGGVGDAARDFGFLSYKSPVVVQEGLIAFQQVWGQRPLVPNWRRREAITGSVVEDIASTPGDTSRPTQLAAQLEAEVDISRVPRTPEALAEWRGRRALARYEVGNALFLSLGLPDSAAAWYERIIEEDTESPVAPRALYALAEVNRQEERTEKAETLYRRLLDEYPDSELAAQARRRLGQKPQERAAQADSLALAERAYADAYSQWRSDANEAALQQMLSVAVAYETTPVQPRALLAAGLIYTEWSKKSGRDLFEPWPATLRPADSTAVLPDSLGLEPLYASIETRFPRTPYAERASALREALEALRAPEETPEETPADEGTDEAQPEGSRARPRSGSDPHAADESQRASPRRLPRGDRPGTPRCAHATPPLCRRGRAPRDARGNPKARRAASRSPAACSGRAPVRRGHAARRGRRGRRGGRVHVARRDDAFRCGRPGDCRQLPKAGLPHGPVLRNRRAQTHPHHHRPV